MNKIQIIALVIGLVVVGGLGVFQSLYFRKK